MRRPTPTGRPPQRRVLLESITAFCHAPSWEQSRDPCPVHATLLWSIFFSSSHPSGLRFHYISLILSFHLSVTSAPFFQLLFSSGARWEKNQKHQIVILDIKTIQSQFAKMPFSWSITLRTTEKSVCVFCVPSLFTCISMFFFSGSPEWVDVQSIWTTVKHWLLTLDCFFSLSLTNFIAQHTRLSVYPTARSL